MKPRLDIRFDKELRRSFRRKEPLYCPGDNEFLLNHARSGLLLALQALGLPQGGRVGVMVYNCHTVMNAVAQAGCVPVFIDIDDNLRLDLTDLKRKSSSMMALIVTHLFGIVNDIEAIRKCCPQLIVIEDCAHAFGKPIEGDFGVYSIGPGKLPSLGDGGILVVNNSVYTDTIKSLYGQLSAYSRQSERNLFAKLLLMHWANSRCLYGWLSMPLKRLRKQPSGKEPIAVKKMSTGVQAMLGLRKAAINGMISQRRENARKEMERLAGNPLVLKILLGENAFMMPVISSNPLELKKQYAQRGVETATHFANSIAWANEFGYQGDCPNAELLLKELLMVPIY